MDSFPPFPRKHTHRVVFLETRNFERPDPAPDAVFYLYFINFLLLSAGCGPSGHHPNMKPAAGIEVAFICVSQR